MLGDVLLIGEMHKIAATTLLKEVVKRKKRDKFIVAIAGESGSGKSELSHVLSRLLKKQGVRTKIIHADNYYNISPNLRTEWRLAKGLDKIGRNEYDWTKIHENVADFKLGRIATMPCIDIIPEQVDKLITNFEGIDLIVVDGLYAIDLEEADLKVFIDLTYHETKMNQISRGKEPMNETRVNILEMEHRAVQGLREKSDLVINKNYRVEDSKTGELIADDGGEIIPLKP